MMLKRRNNRPKKVRKQQKSKKRYGMLRGELLLSGALVVLLSAKVAMPVYATQETQEALKKAKAAASQTRQAVDEGQDQIEDLGKTKTELSDQLDDYSSQLSTLSGNLARLSSQISDKNTEIEAKQEEIDKTQKELDEAIQTQENQYESMKKRIQFIYEKGNGYYLEILLRSNSYGDLLNRSNYIEAMNEYDQKTLQAYKETAKAVSEKKEELEAEQEELEQQQQELESLHNDVNQQAEAVNSLVSQTAGALNTTNAQISSAQDAVELLQDQLKEQNATVSALEQQLAEERRLQALSDASAWRSLSNISFEEGDRTLLANLIYCEAGGESYQGQVAVGAVVMNRLMSGAFPNTVSGVIYQKNQFSPAMSGRLAVALANNEATDSCYQAADAAMSGQTNVGDCLFFRTPIPEVTPKYTIGGHIFY